MRVFVRSMSALLFAATLTAITLASLWYMAMKGAEASVQGVLKQAFGGQVSFSSMQWNYDFMQTHLTLNDVTAVVQDTKTGVQMTHRLGRAEVFRDFFGGNKLIVKLAREQEFSVSIAGQAPIVYPILAEGAEVSFFTEEGNEEVYLTVNTLVVQQTDRAAGPQPFFSARDAYMIHKKGADKGVRMAVKNPKASLFGEDYRAKDVLLDFDTSNVPAFWRKLLLPALATNNDEVLRTMVVHLADLMSESKKRVTLKDLRLTLLDDTWLAAQGSIGADARLRPAGQISFGTNTPNYLYNLIRSYSPFDENLLEEKRFRRTLIGDQDTLNLDVAVNQGALTFNALLAAVWMPLPQVLEVEFEEEVSAP